MTAVAALIIAGGKTSLGGVFEPEKELGTIPAIRRIVMIFRRATTFCFARTQSICMDWQRNIFQTTAGSIWRQ